MADDGEQTAGSSTGSIWTRKTGPLPNWMWAAIALLLALVYALWQRNRSAASSEGPSTDTADDTLDNQTPPPVFILPQNPQPTVPVNVTVNNPPGTPPPAPPVATKPPPTQTPPKPSAPTKTPAVAYDQVGVVAYTSKNPPWNSTLWGIAKHYGYGSAADNYKAILNDPKNAALKKKIGGDPKKLPKGATVYVRRK